MPVDKIKVQHKFGIISHNHRQHLLERISATSTPNPPIKSLPCEISHEFISTYNKANPLDRKSLDIQASQLLQRIRRRAGLTSGGEGHGVHIPRAWVELTLLARCKGTFRQEVLRVLVASLLIAPLSIKNMPSLFLVAETVIEWIKEFGNPIPETPWSVTQLLTLSAARICFWRIHYHSCLHNLQGCDSLLSDISFHLDNLEFIRRVYYKYPDGELLLRQIEGIKAALSNTNPTEEDTFSLMSEGLIHALDFHQHIKSGAPASNTLSCLLTTLGLLGTEEYLNTALVMRCFALAASKNFLALQILQASATGTLPLQSDSQGARKKELTGVGGKSIQEWDWVIALEFINLLVYVTIYGSSSDIQRSAIRAGELTAVRVDNTPVRGLGLLDLAEINSSEPFSPAVQYGLYQGLARVHIHLQSDPLRKSAAHSVWMSLQSLNSIQSARSVYGIGANKSEIQKLVALEIKDCKAPLVFERILDSLADHYLPQPVNPVPQKPAKEPSKPARSHPAHPTHKKVSINMRDKLTSRTSKLTNITPISSSDRTFPTRKLVSYEQRNNKMLQEVVADQWYKELMAVFRAAEKAKEKMVECEKLSEVEESKSNVYALVEELQLEKSDVCQILDPLVPISI